MTVEGTEFETHQSVTVTIAGEEVEGTGMFTDSAGDVRGEITIPEDLESGANTLAVRDAAGHAAMTIINIEGGAAGEVAPETEASTEPATPPDPSITPEEESPFGTAPEEQTLGEDRGST